MRRGRKKAELDSIVIPVGSSAESKSCWREGTCLDERKQSHTSTKHEPLEWQQIVSSSCPVPRQSRSVHKWSVCGSDRLQGSGGLRYKKGFINSLVHASPVKGTHVSLLSCTLIFPPASVPIAPLKPMSRSAPAQKALPAGFPVSTIHFTRSSTSKSG